MPGWTAYLNAFEDAGADMVEVGLPFSDPTVDGAHHSGGLGRGARPRRDARLGPGRPRHERATGIPLVASTYANIALRPGFGDALTAAGVTGLIVPDLPLDELAGLRRAGRPGEPARLPRHAGRPARRDRPTRSGLRVRHLDHGHDRRTRPARTVGPSLWPPGSSRSRTYPCCWASASPPRNRRARPRRSPTESSSARPSCDASSTGRVPPRSAPSWRRCGPRCLRLGHRAMIGGGRR